MEKLIKYIMQPFLSNIPPHKIGLFGGSFKPPHKGHLMVVENALKLHSDLDEFYILVGKGIREGITQEESIKIWEAYLPHLYPLVKVIPCDSPLTWVKNYLKENTHEVKLFIGTRAHNNKDIQDFKHRSKFLQKYSPLLEIINIKINSDINSTRVRKSLSTTPHQFYQYLPEGLSPQNKNQIWGLLKESYTSNDKIDLKKEIAQFTKYMLNQGYNISPLPKLILHNGDKENAGEFLGKTAYYNPETKTIILYTEGRHPKDLMKSYSHEIIHHIQNLEGRLHNINTTNTNKDSKLEELEEEAYLKGNIIFRNWTDNMQN